MKVCVIARLNLSESRQEFLHKFVLHCASIQHLGCMNVLAYALTLVWSCEYEI